MTSLTIYLQVCTTFRLPKVRSCGVLDHLLTKGRPVWRKHTTNRQADNGGQSSAEIVSGRRFECAKQFQQRLLTQKLNNS
jgi:hypothetical protein